MAARTPGIGPDDGCLVQCTTSGRSPSITNGFGVRSTRPLLRAALTCVDASTPDQSPRAAAADTHVAVALACTARSTYLWHFFVKYQSRFARRTSSRSIARSRSMGRTPASRSCLRCAMPSDPITATTSMLTSWRRYLDRLEPTAVVVLNRLRIGVGRKSQPRPAIPMQVSLRRTFAVPEDTCSQVRPTDQPLSSQTPGHPLVSTVLRRPMRPARPTRTRPRARARPASRAAARRPRRPSARDARLHRTARRAARMHR